MPTPADLESLYALADAAIVAGDYATARTHIVRMELALRLVPNTTRDSTSITWRDTIIGLLDLLAKLENSATGIQRQKYEYHPALPYGVLPREYQGGEVDEW